MTTSSTNPGLTDLGPFFERYDRRTRRLMATVLAIALLLSAVIAARLLTAGAPASQPAALAWGLGVVFAPALIAAWWIFTEFMIRQRRKNARAGGSYPASTLDARNGMRIANAGFAFNLALVASAIQEQALMALPAFGHPVPGDLIARVTMIAVGASTIYLGNLWPRMPAPRAPQHAAVVMMKAHRFSGWLMVTAGVLIVLLGLFLPLLYR